MKSPKPWSTLHLMALLALVALVTSLTGRAKPALAAPSEGVKSAGRRLRSGLVSLVLLVSCVASPPSPPPLVDPGVLPLFYELATEVPVRAPVTLTLADLSGEQLLGQSWNRWDRYEILLEETLTPTEQRMVLMHEWAHLVVWDQGLLLESGHGDEWGKALARVFRAYADE